MDLRRIPQVALLLALPGCLPTVTSLLVSTDVPPGGIFEVLVRGVAPQDNDSFVACILQLPNGCQVIAGEADGDVKNLNVAPTTSPYPYIAEPACFLTTFAAQAQTSQPLSGSASLRVFVRAPSAPTTLTVKIALVGSSNGIVPSDPPSITNFASITGSRYSAQVAVTNQPTQPLLIDSVAQLTRYAGSSTDRGTVDIGDIDLDGLLDIAAIERTGTLHTFLRRGTGWLEQTFPNALVLGGTFRLADINGDGYLDIVDAYGQILTGDGGQHWTPAPRVPISLYAQGWIADLQVVDLDSDGDLDVAAVGRDYYLQGQLQIFLNNNGVWPSVPSEITPLPNSTGPWSLSTGDIDGDGIIDLVTDPIARLGHSDGTGTVINLPTSQSPAVVQCVGDVDGNGTDEVSIRQQSSPNFHDVYSMQAGQWVLQATVPLSGQLFPMDCDGDGDLDFSSLTDCQSMTDSPTIKIVTQDGPWTLSAPQSFAGILGPVIGSGNTTYYRGGGIKLTRGPDGTGVATLMAVGFTTDHILFEQLKPNWSGVHSFGSGCTAPGLPTPSLQAVGTAVRGNSAFALGLSGGTPGGLGWLWVGTSMRAWNNLPLPFPLDGLGAPDCTLLTAPDLLYIIGLGATGAGQLPMPIPNDPALLLRTYFAQGAVVQPTANPASLLFSPGLSVRLP